MSLSKTRLLSVDVFMLGKSKRGDTLVRLTLKEIRELEEARRKEANTAMDHFLQMLVEQESKEDAAWAKEMRELEEARRKEANTAMDHFLQMLVERESREAAAWAKETRELEEVRRKEANSAMDHFLQMLVESRDAVARAKEMAEERAEAAEARRQQVAFQQRFLDLFAKLVEEKQASVPPTLDKT